MVVTWDYMCAGQGNKQVNSSCVGSPPASGLLITRGRVPLRRKLGLSPSEGGHPEFPKKSELKGWGKGRGRMWSERNYVPKAHYSDLCAKF